MLGIYFSGTGNTKYCVKTFVNAVDSTADIISIEDFKSNECPKVQEIAFGYPVYYSNLPKIVRDFVIHNADFWNGKKIYIIATMGLFSGDGAGVLARLLKTYGAEITGGLHLKMPDCIGDEKLLKKPLNKNREIVAAAAEKAIEASKDYISGSPTQEGLGLIYHAAGLLGQRLWFYNHTKNYSDKVKIDNNKCISCGVCVRLCPMDNLRLEESIITNNKCTLCYRCFSYCPTQAITILGKTVHEQSKLENFVLTN